MARTERTRPTSGGVQRALIGKVRSREAGSSLIHRMRAEQLKSRPEKAKRLMKQFKGLTKFEDTLPQRNIGRVKRNPFKEIK